MGPWVWGEDKKGVNLITRLIGWWQCKHIDQVLIISCKDVAAVGAIFALAYHRRSPINDGNSL
jgi:hypothetical protein